MAIVVLLTAIAVAFGIVLIVIAAPRLRRPAELRGDWWNDFERQFRAYTEQRGWKEQM